MIQSNLKARKNTPDFPNRRYSTNIDYNTFKKNDTEKGLLYTLRKQNERKLRARFGTKRPHGNAQFQTIHKFTL